MLNDVTLAVTGRVTRNLSVEFESALLSRLPLPRPLLQADSPTTLLKSCAPFTFSQETWAGVVALELSHPKQANHSTLYCPSNIGDPRATTSKESRSLLDRRFGERYVYCDSRKISRGWPFRDCKDQNVFFNLHSSIPSPWRFSI